MTFEEYLIEKNIPFKKEGDDIWVEDSNLVGYLQDITEKFPFIAFEFIGEEIDAEFDPDLETILKEEFSEEDWDDYWEDDIEEELEDWEGNMDLENEEDKEDKE